MSARIQVENGLPTSVEYGRHYFVSERNEEVFEGYEFRFPEDTTPSATHPGKRAARGVVVTERKAIGDEDEVVPIHQVSAVIDLIEFHLQEGQAVVLETDSKSRKLLRKEAKQNRVGVLKKAAMQVIRADAYVRTHDIVEEVRENPKVVSAKQSLYEAAVLIHADIKLNGPADRAKRLLRGAGLPLLATVVALELLDLID